MKFNYSEQTICIDNLARNIWKRRKAVRLTQEMLADKTGISAQYIYLLENGKIKNPGIFTVKILADFFGCEIADMLSGKVEEVAS